MLQIFVGRAASAAGSEVLHLTSKITGALVEGLHRGGVLMAAGRLQRVIVKVRSRWIASTRACEELKGRLETPLLNTTRLRGGLSIRIVKVLAKECRTPLAMPSKQ